MTWFGVVEFVVAGLAVALSLLFYQRAVMRDEALSATSHWGGLGGGIGGWRVSTALVTFVGAVFMWALAAALAIYWHQAQREDEKLSEANKRTDAATALKNQREDAATELKNQREDSANDAKNKREDAAAKAAQQEKLRLEERDAQKAKLGGAAKGTAPTASSATPGAN